MNDKENQTTGQGPSELKTPFVGEPLGTLEEPRKPSMTDPTEPKGLSKHSEYDNAVHGTSFAAETHEYIREQIQFADQKAAFVFLAAAATLGYLNDKGITKLWNNDPHQWRLANLLSFGAVFSLLVGATAALLVILPRLKGASRGIVFWKSIGLFQDAREYADEILASSEERLTRAKAEHVYELANVCKRKFTVLNIALWMGGVGLFATVLYFATS